MPELPEVETVRRELEPWLTGRTVVDARRIDAPPGPKYARIEDARGQRITAVRRRGKFLLLPLEGPEPSDAPDVLVIHLGMTGVITPVLPSAHERARLTLDDGPDPVVHFRDPRRFGRFLLLEGGDLSSLPTLAQMGPEPLEPAFTPRQLHAELAGRSVAIKTLLLSQRPVAGVGNIYADEALWRARVHPTTPAERLTRAQVRAVHQAIRDVLTDAIASHGTTLTDYRTVNGDVGGYGTFLSAYGREGEPCPRCGTSIERLVVGARSTHVCRTCQRRPRKRRTQKRRTQGGPRSASTNEA